ncbi:histone H3-lysine(4) N-trimethyltransferase ATX1 [Sesamum alatum]|uniref:Histone H3-lysine(4) N-trimethyltransferase ATX1 n=1 Tax=Sesamum alatum TaxID=300844 RepID=A0AAE2C8R9_9LAMI|nr:histone H3-lysine(4) N-trimethyltransferase ATX1 [Sesamum alatum]
MTGGGRCQRRRKSMAGGGRGTAEAKKFDSNCNSPNLNLEITEKPSGFPNITKLPPTSTVEFDLYTQARKVLSFRSPFDSEDSQAPQAFLSGANTLPSGVSQLLTRHSDSRKRHKKLHSGSENKSSTPGRPRGSSFWVETEEYFRELTVEDIESLDRVSRVGLSSNEKWFLIPSLDNEDNDRYGTFNRMLASACEKDIMNFENGVELNSNGKLKFNEIIVQDENGPHSMDIDGDVVETEEYSIKEESNEEKIQTTEKESTSFSGVEWLLGSRSKIYLASERPSKKRKLLGRDAGLEKLLVARAVEGSDSVCHYCSFGDTGDPLNCLIKCSSCGMVVHQRCYGVQEDVDSSWLCSWCKWKNVVDLSTETPCLLCPRQGGALKPVRKRGYGSENEGSKVEFAHLFCCQWMPEVYLENTRTMEPIMNVDELKDTRRKLICYLCKVKSGACLRCSNGSCRTSFHPICAREARHRMEIWGKLGSDEVELRAFCSKHSEVQCDSGSQDTGDTSLPAGLDPSKLNDVVLDGEVLPDNRQSSESHQENGDALHPAAKYSTNRNDKEDVNAYALNFTMILKKLIDLGKVNAKDVASEIGVSPDSLNAVLDDNHMVPELQCKLLRWLKNHAHIGNLQKTLKVKIRSLVAPKPVADAALGVGTVSIEESSISDAVPIKSVPPRRRTKSSIRTVKDDKSCSFVDKTNDDTAEGDIDSCLLVGEDPNGTLRESLADESKKILVDPEQHQDDSPKDSIRIEDELRALAQSLCEDGPEGETKQSRQMTNCSLMLTNGEANHASYVHPFIYSKMMQTRSNMLDRTPFYQSGVPRDQEASQLEASSSSGLCCSNHSAQATSDGWTSGCNGVNLDQLVKATNLDMLKLSPADDVEGELIYYQTRLLCNAAARKRISDDLISKVVRSLPQEIDAAGKQKWDAVLVSQYNHDLREAKKQGRKERRHKEAQAVLAAATAAAAASSRISSIRKDAVEESSQQEDRAKINVSDMRPYSQLNRRVKETISRSTTARSSFDTNSDSAQLASDFSKDHPRTCDVCRRSETVLNPILVCTSCKVAVHLDCYRSVKSTTGPWHCELCEDLFSSRGSGALATNSWEKPYFVAECGLCGGTAGAFRKSIDGQWIHALCAEWVLESTYRRGQVNPIEGMDSVCRGVDTCTVCRRKQGVCLKCSYGHCQTTFHPTCARSAGFYMTVRTNGGKLHHKAYCEKHSIEQRAKADTHRHGIEEFKSLKQVRVELERLRLLCERIIKREKLKRELVLCSHDILASSRDSVLSALARHPFYQPEVSSESATTSIKGYTDGYKSGSDMVQRSDDITVDSAVAGKRRVKLPMSVENDQKTDDSSTSQNLYTLKPMERVSFSGKQIPQRLSAASRNLSDDLEKRTKFRKHTETFEKELIMTSDQASMKNQRLPKGFVYVPVRCLSKDKETVPDACSREPMERNG